MKKTILAMAALAAGTLLATGPKMNAVYTVPHELDALLKGGHIQGASCDESGIYLAHAMGIIKIDWTGKKIAEAFGQSHIGDCGVWNDKVYAAVALRPPKMGADGKKYPGMIGVWDAKTLKPLGEKLLPENADGLVVKDGVIHWGIDRWGRNGDIGNEKAAIGRMDLNLNVIDEVVIDFGFNILWGVQTMATDGKDLFFSNYAVTKGRNAEKKANVARCTGDLKLVDTFRGGFSEGFGMVPKSVSKRDTPVFFSVCALGGNMQGWRKDPTNNPPRIAIAFAEYADGKFTDITIRDKNIR